MRRRRTSPKVSCFDDGRESRFTHQRPGSDDHRGVSSRDVSPTPVSRRTGAGGILRAMHRHVLAEAALAVSFATLAACARTRAAEAPDQRAEPRIRVERLGDGIFAAIRREPLALAGNANSLIVIGDRDVTVVDAQFTREATLETLAAVRALTPRPVRYVINTHWHDDHLAGNQVYRDTFPEVEFVLHANTLADLKALGAPNRTGTRDGAPPLVAEYDRRLAAGLGIDSTPVSPLERESVSNAIRIMRQYLTELPAFRETTEGITVGDRLTLGQGATRMEVRWFGRGNTRGDLVVHLPAQGIVATGDLIVWPVPFAFNSYPAEWVAVLDSIAALRPAVLVPGHGPVFRDLSYLRREQTMLTAARDSGAAAAARGDSLPKALREIRLEALKREAGGDDEKWLGWMFENFFRRPALAAAYGAAKAR
jgi:glyoxylase-like metal-dependent hydrolase (beta-lactamase superfamily II)